MRINIVPVGDDMYKITSAKYGCTITITRSTSTWADVIGEWKINWQALGSVDLDRADTYAKMLVKAVKLVKKLNGEDHKKFVGLG